ncbi:Polyphosphate:AMP phosphotransferase [Gammaproteobacteria bacterium]
MFEAAELGRTLSAQDYREEVPLLREQLLQLQDELRDANFSVIILFHGVDGAGKGETVNLLNAWMDPRGIVTRAFGDPSDEARERPEFWRFWRELPPKGRIALFLSSWYSRPILDHVYGLTETATFERCLNRIVTFERMLVEDGALLIKCWMHLGKKAQKGRLKSLEKDPRTRWRITQTDWKHFNLYDRFIDASEHVLHRTATGETPWTIIEGYDPNYREITVGRMVRDAIRRHLEQSKYHNRSAPPTLTQSFTAIRGGNDASRTVLSHLDMTLAVDKKEDYKGRLEELQGKLNLLFRRAKQQRHSLVVVFEGWDAAGKGGTIRRVTAALDARDYQVIPIAAPTDEEQAHHYLWRFWRHLPQAGRVTIFDRSWYGRVLVERIEGFAPEPTWMRAYSEITDFEEQLHEHNILVVKFWLHVTQEEQLRRFEERKITPYKHYKLTEEDWRNREKWDLYDFAVNDMVERTSTRFAPWTLVEANDKRYARIKVLKTLCDRLAIVVDKLEEPSQNKESSKKQKT